MVNGSLYVIGEENSRKGRVKIGLTYFGAGKIDS
jgi:hypothetical protein